MSENNVNTANTANAAPAASKPKKLKRHFWLWPLLIGFALTILGQIIGDVTIIPFEYIFDIPDMWQFSLMYLSFYGIILVVLGFCALCERPIFKTFLPAGKGGLKNNTVKDFFIGVLFGFIMNGGCIFIAWLHGDLHFSIGEFLPVYFIVTFICVTIQSSAEEMITRGYIYQAHAERYPVWFALIGNSLLFGALHLGNEGITVISFVELFASGFALSLAVYARKSIWFAYGCHAMWNFTQSIIFGLPNSGIVSRGSFLHLEAASGSFCYDPVFGVEGTIFSVLSEFLVIGWCIWLIMKDKKKKSAENTAA